MRFFSRTKSVAALAVVISAASVALYRAPAQDQPGPAPTATTDALPAGIVPGSPLADVLKMVQAGVDVATIQSYIANAQSPFNLDADTILYLKDAGVPSILINAMMDRDKAIYAANASPPQQQPVPPPDQPAPYQPAPDTSTAPAYPDTTYVAPPDTAPPPAEVSVNYFYDSLSPYGSWVDVEGYGRCWRPTTVIYDASWRPYCDRGHWIYTDYGWYWDSDYAWGVAFHYGRWFRDARMGWCWYPDTVWAPSWVTWRSGDDYCGWAPLPPFAAYRPGAGFYYRGASVSVGFDFGLAPDSFMFVSAGHFCDREPRSYCVSRDRVTEVYHHTTVINNYNVVNKTIVNRGFGVDRVALATHRDIKPIRVSELPDAGHQGWRGEGYQHTLQHTSGAGYNRLAGMNNNSHPDNKNNNRTYNNANVSVRPNENRSGQFNSVNGNNGNRVSPTTRINENVVRTDNNNFNRANNNNVNGNVVHAESNNNYQRSQTQGSRSFYQQQPQTQTQTQLQTRRADTYTGQYRPPVQGSENQAQTRAYNYNNNNNNNYNYNYNRNAVAGGATVHGGEQLQQHQGPVVQPRQENRNYIQPNASQGGGAPNQYQQRYTGNGGNGGNNSNNSNGGNNGGNGRNNQYPNR